MNHYSTIKAISLLLSIWSAIQDKMNIYLQYGLFTIGLLTFLIIDNNQYKRILEEQRKER